ncbi:DUF6221 family protein [Streptomyces sp. NPDC058657]|uniref:DUF6221 family protein n=1 Tax=unclassified Streptomyces TaxID=2593676 RepID=UPI003668EFD9
MDTLLDFVETCLDADEAEMFGEPGPHRAVADGDALLSSDDWKAITFGCEPAPTAEYRATIQARRRALQCHEYWCDGDCMGALGPDPSYYEAVRVVACAYTTRLGFDERWRIGVRARRAGSRASGQFGEVS